VSPVIRSLAAQALQATGSSSTARRGDFGLRSSPYSLPLSPANRPQLPRVWESSHLQSSRVRRSRQADRASRDWTASSAPKRFTPARRVSENGNLWASCGDLRNRRHGRLDSASKGASIWRSPVRVTRRAQRVQHTPAQLLVAQKAPEYEVAFADPEGVVRMDLNPGTTPASVPGRQPAGRPVPTGRAPRRMALDGTATFSRSTAPGR
jgi:hypothetical protein